jgi:peptidoglycan hydrolase-like protein with peptidoglycan-binding domain
MLYPYSRTLKLGSTGADVKALQQFLNSKGFTVTATGPGSPGLESTYFGPATHRAVIRFQETYRAEILTPNGLTSGTGVFGPSSIRKANGLR